MKAIFVGVAALFSLTAFSPNDGRPKGTGVKGVVTGIQSREVARLAPAADPPVAKEPPKVVTDNKNTLVKTYRDKLKATASTEWPTWEAKKLIDGDVQTSWFSAGGDAAALKKKPWVALTFPEDVTVTRVTILGNREPSWYNGFTILDGMVEFLDADGKQLWVDENTGVGNRCDFEFKPKEPVKGVRSIKFTSLKDEGDKTGYKDIAIGEFLAD